MLHGVAERHVGGKSAELRLVFGKASDHARCFDRAGRRDAEECGRGGRHAGDGVRFRRHLLDKDPGELMLRHARRSCGAMAARARVEAGEAPVHCARAAHGCERFARRSHAGCRDAAQRTGRS